MACVRKRRNRWVIDYYDQSGRRRWETLPEGVNKKKANKRLGEIEKKIEQGTFVPIRELPLFPEVADKWLASKKSNTRHSTHRCYEGHIRNYLCPHFKRAKINHVSFDAIEKLKKDLLEKHTVETPKVLQQFAGKPWFADLKTLSENKKTDLGPEEKVKYEEAMAKARKLSKEERRCLRLALEQVQRTARPMTPATLRKILITLGGILTYAVRMRYIDFNPCREIEKPKGNSLHEEKKEMVILKPSEIRSLLNVSTSQREKVLFMTAVMTGAREGEILGLQWEDIDWFNSQLFVRRTFNHGKFMEPKSKTSRRKIDLAPELVHELKKWKLACPKGALDLVFPSEAGTPWDNTNMVRRCFLRALRKAGLPKIRFHDLRHTYASLLIAQGEHPKYIQTQMGHSSINVTMDIYGHLMDTVNQKAACRLGRSVLGEDIEKPVEVPATI